MDNVTIRRKCINPWLELQVGYNFNVGCCCYYNGTRPKWNFLESSHFDLSTYWNNDFFQHLRDVVNNNNYFKSGCKDCQELKFNFVGRKFIETQKVNKLNRYQKENYLKAINNVEQKRTVIDNLPVRYYFNFGLDCNLNCIMCSQHHIRKNKYNILSANIFNDLKDYFLYAERIILVGGEPLFIPECISFIKKFIENKQLEDVTLVLITNGTLINKYTNLLKNVKKLNISISLDSIEETYEHIRKGSSWRHIEHTILNIKNSITKEKLDWNISISCVLMKSSLKNLLSFLKWAVDNNLTSLVMVPVVNNSLNNSESIFDFPQLLDEIPNWQDLLTESIEFIKKYDKISYSRLKVMYKWLQDSYRLYKQHKNLYPFERIYLSNKELIDFLNKSGKFVIWGTGGYYRNYFSYFIKTKPSNFLGFIDNNSSLWDSEVDEYKVFPPNMLFKLKPDSILIASTFIKDIKSQIINMGIDFCRVY